MTDELEVTSRPRGRFLGRGRRFGAGPRGGRMGGLQAAGPGGSCVCPHCNHRVAHRAGQPCSNTRCPECGTRMVRED